MHCTKIEENLFKGAQNNDYNKVKEALEIITPEQSHSINYYDALYQATNKGNYEIVVLILKNIPIDRLSFGILHQSLIRAISRGNLAIVRLFYELGVDIHANYEDALRTAINSNNEQVARFLILQANANYKIEKNQNPRFRGRDTFPSWYSSLIREKENEIKKNISEIPEKPPNYS